MHDMKGRYAQLMRHVIYCSYACAPSIEGTAAQATQQD